MNTDAQLRFNRRKRPLSADGRLHDHLRGQQRKRRGARVLVPDCFLVPPPEAKSADFDMWDYIRNIPDRLRLDNGLRLLKGWVRASKDVPQDPSKDVPQDLAWGNGLRLLKDNDVKPGRVVVAGKWKVDDPVKVALKASAPREEAKPCWKDLHEKTKHNDKRLGEIPVKVDLLEKTLEEQRKKAEPPKEDLSQFFVPLTAEDEKEVQDCLYGNGSSSKVLVLHEPSNIEVSRGKIRCLRPHGWLNDEVINLYLELLKERGIREPKRFLKCHFFNTFFYKKIFVPVHQNVHWCLAIINMKAKKLQYLDSLGGHDPRVSKMLARYIVDEVKDKSNKKIDISSLTEESIDCIPLQGNGWDCGMFMLKYIDFHSRGVSLSFGQEHMEYFRKRTAKEILRLRAD
ncbi:putative ubiquitin-like-specific protease 1B isoform X2 [Hordeum vulgare subsp. vulgare]|uniref:putative ubiquitin-like-specific protease 1B isoform X2 n=1 Tax=Hordeum vulgare subsp. vulgare TaxID=112509 RepID=UPI000295B261|nr:putative ubiquitin-like-specific protease 1B isoform X2 [Hordeum vulgare subsp. vulgare]